MTNKRIWQGDIVVRGTMQNARQLAKFLGISIEETKSTTDTYPYIQETYCGGRATSAANMVRRFLAIGIIPKIEADLTGEAAAGIGVVELEA